MWIYHFKTTSQQNHHRFSTLVTAVTEAGLVDTVKGAKAMTIFAPTNDAFAKVSCIITLMFLTSPLPQVPSDALTALLADKDALTKVLLRHVVAGANVFSKGVMWAETETAGGESVATQVFRRGVVKVSERSGIVTFVI